ncbi:phosphotransferase [Thermasporomyces composti]|uniref:phosphotransferase n=1 Tax=Thermasporomyces composti TaxID=696763 RepID=UPI000E22BE1C|nr:phosphotransferase [Thermasporomyces composti]
MTRLSIPTSRCPEARRRSFRGAGERPRRRAAHPARPRARWPGCAAYVRWPDGREGVLTLLPGGHGARARQVGEVLNLARQRGLPVPAYDLVAEVPDATAIVQERLPGSPPSRVDRRLVEEMVALHERFAGLLAGRTDVEVPDLYLRASGPGFCLHRPLELHSARSRRLLAWVRDVGAASDAVMSGADLVHLDYHGERAVDASGAITGVVDWDGIGRGDRRFALVTLRFALSEPGRDETLARWVDGLVDDLLDPATRRVSWAHMSLRMADWAIRHFGPGDVDHWLDVAEAGMDR